MNYHLKSKKNNNFKKILIIGILVLLVFLIYKITFPFFRSFAHTTAVPVWTFRDYVANSFASIGNIFESKDSLIIENEVLKEEIKGLKLKQMEYEVLVKENSELKALFGRDNLKNKIITKIVSKPPRSPYDTLIIDAGSRDGVKKDSLVYISNNVVVGKVSDVLENSSVVTLFSTGGYKQESMLERTGAVFELIGKGNANLSIELPKDTDIVWGDVFLYPSVDSSIIGNVYYIDTNSQSAFKTVFIRVPGNVFESKWLFVETNE